MDETEWLTRKKRNDTSLRSLQPPWQIIRCHDGLDLPVLHCVAVEEFPTANGTLIGFEESRYQAESVVAGFPVKPLRFLLP